MANPELVDILRQGSDVWNNWRKQQPVDLWIDLSGAILNGSNLSRADLRKVDLRDVGLYEANLHQANLHEAILRGAHLYGASMYEANLISVDLHEANLRGADLSEARLTGANLHKADLRWSDLTRTDLTSADLGGADLTFAQFFATVIANTDLCQTRGLAQINHQGPSNLTLHSIQFPQDGSAIHFLRGAGVPDEWVDDYRAHTMHPIQYHSCFISYVHQDNAIANRLHADLQDKGVRCWFAPHDMHIGDKIRPRIDEAIHLQDKLLLILSKQAVTSDWVEHEVETALARERRDKRTILFPVRLDAAILERPYTGWPTLVQNERHIGDFTGWKDHDRYQAAFERLMRDLEG